METVSISHHDNTSDGHYGSHNLKEEIKYPAKVRKTVIERIICIIMLCSHTDPNTHEPVLEDYPGQEKDKGLVAAVKG